MGKESLFRIESRGDEINISRLNGKFAYYLAAIPKEDWPSFQKAVAAFELKTPFQKAYEEFCKIEKWDNGDVFGWFFNKGREAEREKA